MKKSFIWIHHHFASIDSTNIWAKNSLLSFDRAAITLVTADQQTQGKGQYGRKWVSPVGNFCGSLCFFLKNLQQDPLTLTHVLALAVVDTFKPYGVKCQLKWPNDILIHGKKIGGILCETTPLSSNQTSAPQSVKLSALDDAQEYFATSKSTKAPSNFLESENTPHTTRISNTEPLLAIVMGLGVNLNMSPSELEKIDQPATSLVTETGMLCSPDLFLNSLKIHFEHYLEIFLCSTFTPFLYPNFEVIPKF